MIGFRHCPERSRLGQTQTRSVSLSRLATLQGGFCCDRIWQADKLCSSNPDNLSASNPDNLSAPVNCKRACPKRFRFCPAESKSAG